MHGYYSTDISAAWEVEEKIKEIRLREKYTQYLKNVVFSELASNHIWYLIHATADQRCRAALLAVMEDK